MALKDEKEKLRVQREYEESLKVSQSFLEGIGKLIEGSAKSQKKLTDAERKYNSGLKSILKDVSSREDILDKSSEAQEKFNKFASDGRRTEKGSIGAAREKNKLLQEGLAAELKTVDAISSADTAQKNLVDSISGTLDGITNTLGDIPIIGGALSNLASGPIENIKEGISLAGQQFVTGFAANMRAGMGGFKAMKASLASLKPLMMTLFNPVTIGIVALVAILALAFKGFSALDNAAKAFREETGLLNSQTEGLSSNIAEVTMQTSALGASAEDVAKAAAAFTNEFAGVVQPSKETLANVVALEKNFGVSASSAAKVNEIFQSIGGLSERAAQALVSQTVQAAKLVGVAPNKVIADIAENAETAAVFFQGSVGDLAKAAVEAARLGTSLTQAAAVSKNLLDFENSITAELEASAMLGQSINFNKARELAANRDIIGAQQAVLDEASKIGNLNELNTFQLESIAKASGMEVGELQKQIKIREKFGPLNAQQKAALDGLAAKGNEIKDITKAQLEAETESVIKQQEMQSRLDSISNRFSSIGTNLVTAFAPLMEAIIPALEFMGTLLGGIATFIGHMAKGLQENIGLAIAFGTAVAALVLPMLWSAIAGIFTAFSMIPFGVGIPLAIAAVAGLMSLMGEAQSVGDMFSPANGKTQVSTKEGGLFELSSNDDLAAAPNLLGGAGGGGGAAVSAIEKLAGDGGSGAVVSAIEKLGADIKQLQFVVNMDGAKVADGVSKVNSRSNANTFGGSK